MTDFGIHKPTGMPLYRSVQERQHMFGKTWYGLSPNDTYGYGSITYVYKTKKDLKLIDFTSMNFYNDYLRRLNKTESPFKEKIKTLYPLGFSDKNVYHAYTATLKLPVPIEQPKLETLLTSQLYNGRSRCSINSFDNLMTLFLIAQYKDEYDGIIMEKSLPNIVFNKSQHPEVFIFDEKNIDLVGEIQRTKSGGSMFDDSELPRMQTQLKVGPDIALEAGHAARNIVMRSPDKFSPDQVSHYQNYKYIDEIEKEYGVKLPRPSDAIVKSEARGGGKYRVTRKRRSHKK